MTKKQYIDIHLSDGSVWKLDYTRELKAHEITQFNVITWLGVSYYNGQIINMDRFMSNSTAARCYLIGLYYNMPDDAATNTQILMELSSHDFNLLWLHIEHLDIFRQPTAEQIKTPKKPAQVVEAGNVKFTFF